MDWLSKGIPWSLSNSSSPKIQGKEDKENNFPLKCVSIATFLKMPSVLCVVSVWRELIKECSCTKAMIAVEVMIAMCWVNGDISLIDLLFYSFKINSVKSGLNLVFSDVFFY